MLDIYGKKSGICLRIKSANAGQQDVVINLRSEGTVSKNSSASNSVTISAPRATSYTPLNPIFFKALKTFFGEIVGPN